MRETPVRLDEKRLLCTAEFCTYASIGRENGMKLAGAAAAVLRVGKRVMVDRAKFDRWCDSNTDPAASLCVSGRRIDMAENKKPLPQGITLRKDGRYQARYTFQGKP